MSELNKKYSILFVEDEDEIRRNFVIHLKKYFKNVYEARDGEEGYSLYRKFKPDILFIDINLPKLNGLDLVKKIREFDQQSKIIILTAHFNSPYLHKATELKLTKYLVKPISRAMLSEALNLAIEELNSFSIHSNKLIRLKENFSWDFEKRILYNGDSQVKLTQIETKLFEILMKKFNNTSSYDEIIYTLWDDYEGDKISTLKTIIKNLRKQLPKEMIENIYGVGYKISQQ